MPLTILVPLIVIGTVAVLLAVHFIGGTEEVALTQDEARARFAEDFPQNKISTVHIAHDAKSAWLVLEEPTKIGFIQRFGSGTIVRAVSAEEITHTEFEENRATLHLNDFAMKTVVIEGQPAELRHALDAMKEPAT